MALKRVHLTIRGRVQDAFYRVGTQREARRLGITGKLSSRPDGGLDVVAEGEDQALQQFIAWTQHGPITARVEDVKVKWRSYSGEFFDFRLV